MRTRTGSKGANSRRRSVLRARFSPASRSR